MPDLVELCRQALLVGMVVIAPLLLAGFVTGALTGLVQAATGVHEPVVGFVPRVVIMAVVLVVTLPWMVERLAELLRTTAHIP